MFVSPAALGVLNKLDVESNSVDIDERCHR